MTKVFYSVDYKIQGSDKMHRMWFDNLEESNEFSKADYRASLLSTCTAVKQQ